jgi:hypothetical protein
MMKRSLIWPALLVLSLVSMVFGGYAASQFRIHSARGPLLTEPSALAVGADGRIYCAAGLDRVFGYSLEGKVVAAWSVPGAGSPLRLHVSGKDRIEIARRDDPEVLVYDADGRQLGSRREPGAYARFEGEAIRPDGARFEIREGAIVRTDVDPPETFVAALPWPLVWFGRIPILIVPFLALGPPGVIVAVALAAGGFRSGRERAA